MIDTAFNYMFGIMLIISYAYVISKATCWLIKILFDTYYRCKKEEKQQVAINTFYDTFNLDQIKDGKSMKITTKSGLVIFVYRQKED